MKAFILIFALFTAQLTHAESVKPKYDASFILMRILEHKNLKHNPEIAIPPVLFSSEASLKEFQDDIEPQWGFRPDVIVNSYVAHLNKIYLLDSKEYYTAHKRCIDDSLAHELTHFIQSKYHKWDLNDDSLEVDAIETQTWFREQYCKN